MNTPDNQTAFQEGAASCHGVQEFTRRIPLRGPVRVDLRLTETAALRHKAGTTARTVGISWLKTRISLRNSG